jgi:hypothetical protein
MIVVTAGAAGASGFEIALEGPRERTGTGPGVFAIGVGHSKRGGGLFAVEQAGGPLEVTTTRELGGARVQLTDSPTSSGRGQFSVSFSVGELAPGESALGIAVLGNARFAPLALPAHRVKSGQVKVRMIQLGGTIVTRVADPSSSGAAAAAATAGGGAQSSSPRLGTGTAGGFVTGGANLSTAAWRAPDGASGRWASAVATGAGTLSFAGPPGTWDLTWAGGDAVLGGSPVAWFTTPVGPYWRYLRCHECLAHPAPVARARGASAQVGRLSEPEVLAVGVAEDRPAHTVEVGAAA